MEMQYKNKTYLLTELVEPQKNLTYDIIAIFECGKKIIDNIPFEDLKFINYFYGASIETLESIQTIAQEYIDKYEEEKGNGQH